MTDQRDELILKHEAEIRRLEGVVYGLNNRSLELTQLMRIAQEERDEARLSVKQLRETLDMFREEASRRAGGIEKAMATLGNEDLRLTKLVEERGARITLLTEVNNRLEAKVESLQRDNAALRSIDRDGSPYRAIPAEMLAALQDENSRLKRDVGAHAQDAGREMRRANEMTNNVNETKRGILALSRELGAARQAHAETAPGPLLAKLDGVLATLISLSEP